MVDIRVYKCQISEYFNMLITNFENKVVKKRSRKNQRFIFTKRSGHRIFWNK